MCSRAIPHPYGNTRFKVIIAIWQIYRYSHAINSQIVVPSIIGVFERLRAPSDVPVNINLKFQTSL